jgi:predicted dehydrogenase
LTLFEDQEGKLVTVSLKAKPDDGSGFTLQLENFLNAVRGVAKPINDADQAVALMEMIDGIYASSELGREVPIVP